ncbi:unnamed protein product [Penicillium camemberti]|uniref:Str. FM013 n=1 Tax=Penicillium camemberti (strain FM 013) TaxID=1429867 RepID=A0A0G4NV49_PENC3|nr:unnamed protein product [Penicillium camemberti]
MFLELFSDVIHIVPHLNPSSLHAKKASHLLLKLR